MFSNNVQTLSFKIKRDGGNMLEVSAWIGNDDKEQERMWKTCVTKKQYKTHPPLLEGCTEATKDNCMRLLLSIRDEDNSHGVITGTAVTDEDSVFCPICEVETPTRKIFVEVSVSYQSSTRCTLWCTENGYFWS
jgi:hypothetical protein